MYESRVFVALVIAFIRFIFAFLTINSIISSNYALIGMRLSYLTLSPKQLTKAFQNQNLILKILKFSTIWIIIPLILIFLSWLYVVYLLAIHLYHFSQFWGMPNDVKEFKWKIRNLELSFDQMAELTYIYSKPKDTTFEEFKSSIVENMKEL